MADAQLHNAVGSVLFSCPNMALLEQSTGSKERLNGSISIDIIMACVHVRYLSHRADVQPLYDPTGRRRFYDDTGSTAI